MSDKKRERVKKRLPNIGNLLSELLVAMGRLPAFRIRKLFCSRSRSRPAAMRRQFSFGGESRHNARDLLLGIVRFHIDLRGTVISVPAHRSLISDQRLVSRRPMRFHYVEDKLRSVLDHSFCHHLLCFRAEDSYLAIRSHREDRLAPVFWHRDLAGIWFCLSLLSSQVELKD